jgi:hypothetical protein
MPYKDNTFDLIVCSEVMEHIPEQDVVATFREMLRVGKDKFYFTINLQVEHIPIAGYIQTHITLESPEWWVNRMEEAGMNVCLWSANKEGSDVSIYAIKDRTPYDLGIKRISKTEDFPIMVLGEPEEAFSKQVEYVF